MVTQFNTETSVRAIYYKEWQIVNKQYMKLKRFKKKKTTSSIHEKNAFIDSFLIFDTLIYCLGFLCRFQPCLQMLCCLCAWTCEGDVVRDMMCGLVGLLFADTPWHTSSLFPWCVCTRVFMCGWVVQRRAFFRLQAVCSGKASKLFCNLRS